MIIEGFTLIAARELYKKVAEPPLAEVGVLLKNLVARQRERLEKRFEKLETWRKEGDKEIRVIPDKVLIPLMEGMALEDDEDLAEKWMNLFANTAVTNSKINNSVYATILGQMSGDDAAMFKKIVEATGHYKNGVLIMVASGIPPNLNKAMYLANTRDNTVSLDNLVRLRLIKEVKGVDGRDGYSVTDLGIVFFVVINKKP